jgi:hypothetical protein
MSKIRLIHDITELGGPAGAEWNSPAFNILQKCRSSFSQQKKGAKSYGLSNDVDAASASD